MSDFISKVYIESFRGIKALELNNLLPINILTGDNNSGKTSVLEILNSLKNCGDFRWWRSLTRNDFRISTYEGFYDLFDINSSKKIVAYSTEINGMKKDVMLSANDIEEEMTEEEYFELAGIYLPEDIKKEELSKTVQIPKLEMEIKIDGETVDTNVVYEGERRYRVNPKKAVEEKNIIYISPTRHAEGDVFLSKVLDNPELYEQMLMVLKEFDEDIISINYDESHIASRGVYKILSKSHKKALPLNVYGDGMKKAVLLMSAVIASKDGILLLDEFETAIHTSAMHKTFRWILETCMKLNVQVFLTSHSKEAIDKILKCSPVLTDKIALYTLYKDDDETFVRRLTGRKAIEVQDEMGLELR